MPEATFEDARFVFSLPREGAQHPREGQLVIQQSFETLYLAHEVDGDDEKQVRGLPVSRLWGLDRKGALEYP